MMDQGQIIVEQWRLLRRRFWIIAIICVVGVAGAAVYAKMKPAIYEAQAKILVESQSIPSDLARSMITADAGERLQLIQQRLMARNNLVRVIEDLDLFVDEADLTVSDKIEKLRRATQIRPIALRGQRVRTGSSISAFTINVTFEDPVKAAGIANNFVATVLEQNIRVRSELASETLNFFEKEEERLSAELVTLETEITNFKAENDNALPQSLVFRQTQLTQLTENSVDLDQRMLELEEELTEFEAALDQLDRALAADVQEVNPDEGELRALQVLLAQRRTIYAESHREIRAIKAKIAAIEATPSTSARDNRGDEAAAEARRATLLRRIDLLNSQITVLQDQKIALARRAETLRDSIQRTPNVEIQLNALNRQHKEKQDMLSVITRKRAEAETGERLEVNQQAERFEVIENAIVPFKPVAPNRKKIVMMGGMASVALAVGFAYLLEILRPAIRSGHQLERQLGLKPVISIPYIQTEREKRRRRLRIGLLVLFALICAAGSLFLINEYHTPLRFLGEILIDRIRSSPLGGLIG